MCACVCVPTHACTCACVCVCLLMHACVQVQWVYSTSDKLIEFPNGVACGNVDIGTAVL